MAKLTKELEAKFSAIDYDLEGVSKNDGITDLINIHGLDFSEAGKYWEENRGEVKSGFAKRFYDTLKLEVMPHGIFLDSLVGESPNVARNEKHYNAIRVLTNEIHDPDWVNDTPKK